MKVSSNFNTISYSFKSNGNQTNPVGSSSIEKKQENNNTKKILIGSAIAASILVLFLVRKNISKFAKELFNKGEKEIPTETPKTPKQTDVPTSNPKPDIPPKTPDIPPELPKFDGKKTLTEYKKLTSEQKEFSSDMTTEEKTLWHKQEDKIRGLLNELVDNNVSLVEKAEFSLDPTKDVKVKRAYLLSSKVSGASFNEASKLDYLEMFEKYGSRYWVDEKIKTDSFTNLCSSVGHNASDKVLSKYIDIMDKLAIRDGKGNLGMRDASGVLAVLQFNSQNMSKETFLKCINVLKKTSYQQVDAIEVETALIWTKFKEDKEVLAAIEDLKNALKDFPEIDKTMN